MYQDRSINNQGNIKWHQIVSAEESSNLMQNLMQIRCSTPPVILNVKATQYTCSLNGVYHPHWLAQWSCHCSHMHIPVHSPWLPGYIGVLWTVLIILTVAGLFLDSPCIFYNPAIPLMYYPSPKWKKKFHRRSYIFLNTRKIYFLKKKECL